MGKITFVPVGGLANRVRGVASAVMWTGRLPVCGMLRGWIMHY